jgi:hypothetical protein
VGLVASAAWFAALATGSISNGLQLLIASSLGLVALAPQVAQAASVSSSERRADLRIRHLDANAASDARRRGEEIEQIRNLVPDDPGRIVAARLLLWAMGRRSDVTGLASTTRATYFERAGNAFLRDAQWRRVIGWKRQATPWDEEIALRCFHDEAQSLIPASVFEHDPPVAIGPWAAAVETLLQDLRQAPLRDPVLSAARDSLVEAIRTHLVVATGQRSDAAKDQQAAAATTMAEAWQRVADHLRAIGTGA